MSEAERDIEMLLEGKKVKVNRKANIAYKQRFVDYVLDNSENISDVQFNDLNNYIAQLQPIIEKNLITALTDQQLKQAVTMEGTGSIPPTATPTSPSEELPPISTPNNPQETNVEI